MPKISRRTIWSSLNPGARLSFILAAAVFAAAVAGLAINHTLSNGMAVLGMTGIGLFYMGIGVLNLGWTDSCCKPATMEWRSDETDVMQQMLPQNETYSTQRTEEHQQRTSPSNGA